jgi:uncharacterized membrane protein
LGSARSRSRLERRGSGARDRSATFLAAARIRTRVGQGGQRAVAAAAREEIHGDATPDHAWKVGGLWYFNPRDPAIWVENRIGPGYGLNMGNPRAWLLIAGLILAQMIAARLLF